MAERPPLPHDPATVRRELQRRLPDLLRALGIADLPRAGLCTPLNPRRRDRTRGSFVIWTEGDGAGAWKDYALGDTARGDVFDLVAYLGGLARWIDAYFWALEFLGWGRGEVRTAGQAELDRQRAEADRKAAEARRGAEDDAKAAKARAFWLTCSAEIRGTPAWTYLTVARGLPLERLAAPPGALRFHPALEHFDRDTGEVTAWPCLVSAMSHWDGGQVRAAHYTWLAPDGMGKAPVEKPKKIRGAPNGCAIRLSKGASGLSPEGAAKKGVRGALILLEGIEDGLTAAIARPDDRVWAAGTLGGYAALGWPACASAVVLGQDNDWHEPQAVAGFEKALKHWHAMAAGRPVKAVRAAVGKDLNDWARGVG